MVGGGVAVTLWFWGIVLSTWVVVGWLVVRLFKRRARRFQREAAIAGRLAADAPPSGEPPEAIPPAGTPLTGPLNLRRGRRTAWNGIEGVLMFLAASLFLADHAQGYGALMRWGVFYPLALASGLIAAIGAVMAFFERRDRLVATPEAFEVIEGSGLRRRHPWSAVSEVRIEREFAACDSTPGDHATRRRLVLMGAGEARLDSFELPLAPAEAYERFLAAVPAHVGKPVATVDIRP